MPHHLSPWALWLHLSCSLAGFLMYAATTHTLQQHRNPAAALSWILSFLFMPYLALPAYLFFGQRRILPHLDSPSAVSAQPGPEVDPRRHWISSMLRNLGMPPARDGEPLHLHLTAADAERALWEVIDQARTRLWVSTFVLGNDRIGHALIEHLAAKARAGVDVRLLLDGVGCFMVRTRQLQTLVDAGGRIARAFPPARRLLRQQANFRNHRKVVIADGRMLWMGGRNFADEYFSGDERKAAWDDLSLDTTGAVAGDAERMYVDDWRWATGEILQPMSPAEPEQPAQYRDVQLLTSGPDKAFDPLLSLLTTACYRATQRILLITPYFIPDATLMQALSLAARRNIAVDIVLPRKSNHRLADYARHRALRTLSEAGVRIWLAPRMMHAKAMVFDDMALSGSANIDPRSLFLNFELMMMLYDARHAQELADWIEERRAQSMRFESRPVTVVRDLFDGAVLWLGYQM